MLLGKFNTKVDSN